MRLQQYRLFQHLYGLLNVGLCLLIFCKLGWFSAACVFLSYFFMSIMFPTIFALGIFGLGSRAKQASSYIVMGIVGSAILPKLMGAVADNFDMSRFAYRRVLRLQLATIQRIQRHGFRVYEQTLRSDLLQALDSLFLHSYRFELVPTSDIIYDTHFQYLLYLCL
jgi:hypothetical protein